MKKLKELKIEKNIIKAEGIQSFVYVFVKPLVDKINEIINRLNERE